MAFLHRINAVVLEPSDISSPCERLTQVGARGGRQVCRSAKPLRRAGSLSLLHMIAIPFRPCGISWCREREGRIVQTDWSQLAPWRSRGSGTPAGLIWTALCTLTVNVITNALVADEGGWQCKALQRKRACTAYAYVFTLHSACMAAFAGATPITCSRHQILARSSSA